MDKFPLQQIKKAGIAIVFGVMSVWLIKKKIEGTNHWFNQNIYYHLFTFSQNYSPSSIYGFSDYLMFIFLSGGAFYESFMSDVK